jgi:hypothetical protein
MVNLKEMEGRNYGYFKALSIHLEKLRIKKGVPVLNEVSTAM